MIIEKWFSFLSPYLVKLDGVWASQLQTHFDGEFYGFRHPLHPTSFWEIRAALEPKLQKTHCLVESLPCDRDSISFYVPVFDANNLGWSYTDLHLQNLKCVCGEVQFDIALVFEPYEDAEEIYDFSWFCMWAKCSRCQHQQKVVDWELD